MRYWRLHAYAWMYDYDCDNHVIDWRRIETYKQNVAIKPETVIAIVEACTSISNEERNKVVRAMQAISLKNANNLL